MSEAGARELVERVRAGDEAAWVALTDRYVNLLWSVARGMRLSEADAADAVQTTWLHLVEGLDTLRDPDRVGAWLATTIRRECLAILRRRNRTVAAEGWDLIPDDAAPLDDALLRQERDAALWRAFRALGPRCQALLRVLMADPAPSYAEVSEALDMPIGGIGPTRRRCLDALRKIMFRGAHPFEAPSPGNA
ncbi:RNA polymerase sigma factor [Phytohabitans rumicis]|uniref:RNA polymerase sigma factor n=1 Tax=Phytohabitans rumicis TaxID=1076125 RepID=UPI003531400E